MRRPGIEPEPDVLTPFRATGRVQFLPCSFARRLAHCAGRELNPGYELGKLMSYH